MPGWTPDELTRIGQAEELELASRRRDGSLRHPVTMWVVRDGEELYVRSMHGRSGAWFRDTQTRHQGHIRPGGVERTSRSSSTPIGSGLSRKAIMEQIDASLSRLGTDYVDLYQIHRFDPDTPVEETMQALHDVVTAGKARYLGASSMWAWQLAKMQHAAEGHGWTGFISMQNQYSLMQREEEREMFGLLADQGVGSIP